MRSRKVLVTGGLGFIGSFMAECYAWNGDEVVAVDDCRANVVEDLPVQNARPHDGYKRPAVLLTSVHEFLRTIGLRGFDVVVHCAAPVGSVGVLKHQGTIVSEIVSDVTELVAHCKAARAQLVYVSSSEVYGTSGLYDEADALRVPVRPSARLEYAVGKLAGESVVINNLDRGLRACIVRPFNVAGPRQTSAKGFVLPTFIEQALAGAPLTVYGDGEQERAFTSVLDVCWFVVSHLLGDTEGLFNVGAPANRTTINALAELVLQETGSSSEVVHVDPRERHPAYEEAEGRIKLPQIERATSLGWTPTTGLRQLVQWTRDEAAPELYRQGRGSVAHHPV